MSLKINSHSQGRLKGADSVKVDLSAEDEDIENLEAFAEKVSEALA